MERLTLYFRKIFAVLFCYHLWGSILYMYTPCLSPLKVYKSQTMAIGFLVTCNIENEFRKNQAI